MSPLYELLVACAKQHNIGTAGDRGVYFAVVRHLHGCAMSTIIQLQADGIDFSQPLTDRERFLVAMQRFRLEWNRLEREYDRIGEQQEAARIRLRDYIERHNLYDEEDRFEESGADLDI